MTAIKRKLTRAQLDARNARMRAPPGMKRMVQAAHTEKNGHPRELVKVAIKGWGCL